MNTEPMIIDGADGLNAKKIDNIISFLNMRSLEAQNYYRAKEGKRALTEEQQIKLYGYVVKEEERFSTAPLIEVNKLEAEQRN